MDLLQSIKKEVKLLEMKKTLFGFHQYISIFSSKIYFFFIPFYVFSLLSFENDTEDLFQEIFQQLDRNRFFDQEVFHTIVDALAQAMIYDLICLFEYNIF